MKKKFTSVLTGILIFLCTVIPQMPVWAAGLSISGVPSSVKVGDTFTVTVTSPADIWSTITVSYDASVLSYVSASTEVGGGAGSIFYIDYTASADSVSIAFKAVSAGTASISASASDAELPDGGAASVSGASAKVTVANAAGGTGSGGSGNGGGTGSGSGNGGGTDNLQKSADNSLSSLTLSAGTLSPAFSYKTTNYTAEVDYNVTSIAISATVSNANATIESVSGNENLSVGENTIKIVVRAENGVTAVYTIVVTRKNEGNSEPEETPPQEEENDEKPDHFEVNGQNLTPAQQLPQEDLPEDFSAASVTLGGKEFPSLSFANGNLSLLYLVDENGENGAFYVYDPVQNAVYSFIRLYSENGYVIVLLPDADEIPEGFSERTLSIEGKGMVTAYQETDADPDFYFLYCMNQQGTTGWWSYDTVEGTYQRAAKLSGEPEEDTKEDIQKLKEDYNAQGKALKQEKVRSRFLLSILIFLAVVLLLMIFNMIFWKIRKGKRKKQIEEDDDGDPENLQAWYAPFEEKEGMAPEEDTLFTEEADEEEKPEDMLLSDAEEAEEIEETDEIEKPESTISPEAEKIEETDEIEKPESTILPDAEETKKTDETEETDKLEKPEDTVLPDAEEIEEIEETDEIKKPEDFEVIDFNDFI